MSTTFKCFDTPAKQAEYKEQRKQQDVLQENEKPSNNYNFDIDFMKKTDVNWTKTTISTIPALDKQLFPLFWKLQKQTLKHIYRKFILTDFPHISFKDFVIFAYLSTQRNTSVLAQYKNAI